MATLTATSPLPYDDYSTTTIYIISALGFVAVQWLLCPPITVVLRRLRPLVSRLGLLTWLLLRCSHLDPPKTLLQYLEDFLAEAHEKMVRFVLGTVSDEAEDGSTQEDESSLLFATIQFSWTLTEDAMALIMIVGISRVCYRLSHYSLREWSDVLKNVLWLNSIREETDLATEEPGKSQQPESNARIVSIPEKGREAEEILQELESISKRENDEWHHGKVSGTVYIPHIISTGSSTATKDTDTRELRKYSHIQLLNAVYEMYCWSSSSFPSIWPKVQQCEEELINMIGDMLHLGNEPPPCGSVASGGVQSVRLAVRAHLKVYGKDRDINFPELICGTTAHPAVATACELLGIRRVVVDCSLFPYQLDPQQVRKAITSNTIMIFASVPTLAQGVLDPVSGLSGVAMEHGVGLHLDANVGGFLLPFLDNIPPFDFRCAGVTSISVDIGQYGYAAPGVSILVYRDVQLQLSHPPEEMRVESLPTESHPPGGLVVCAWASLLTVGRDGFHKQAQKIQWACRIIAEGVDMIRGIKVLTVSPMSMIVCIGSDEYDIHYIRDCMAKAGWKLHSWQSPASLQICVTLNVAPKVDTLLRDLKMSVERARSIILRDGTDHRKC